MSETQQTGPEGVQTENINGSSSTNSEPPATTENNAGPSETTNDYLNSRRSLVMDLLDTDDSYSENEGSPGTNNNPQESSCQLCEESDNGQMLGCKKCNLKTHIKCMMYTSKVVKLIKEFYCNDCRAKHDLDIEWNLKQATTQKKKEKRELYFDVNRIIDHRPHHKHKREFLIDWKGNYQPSWEPEHHLDGCYPLLQEYCARNKIICSNIEGVVGASHDSGFLNDKNWVKPSKILEKIITGLRNFKISLSLQIKIWTNELDYQDTLYIVPYLGHCYMVLYYNKKKIGYIADGTNNFMTNPDEANEIKEFLGFQLSPRKFVQQTRVDHCASSAVCIGIELVSHYNKDIKPDDIVVSKTYYKRLIKQLHSEYSYSIMNKKPLDFVTKLKCEFCHRGFRLENAKSFKKHQSICNKQ